MSTERHVFRVTIISIGISVWLFSFGLVGVLYTLKGGDIGHLHTKKALDETENGAAILHNICEIKPKNIIFAAHHKAGTNLLRSIH